MIVEEEARTSCRPSVLVLGGSNFMGKSLLFHLTISNYRVTCINRRKPHWNNESFLLKDKVKFVYGDRDNHIEYGKLLRYLSEKEARDTEQGPNFKWAAVVDFCAYQRKEVKSVIRGLKDLVKLYIFISTDSIYDVCDQTGLSTPVLEEEAVRPLDDKSLYKKAEDEEYGHDKLRCEEYLRSHASSLSDGIPYVCLRLPDVLGPYDSTGRYWSYLLWLQKMSDWPVHSKHESRSKKLSFVFSEDVVGLILRLISKAAEAEFIHSIHGNAFNLAFEENPTLNELIQAIADSVQLGRVNFIEETSLEKISKSDKKGKFFYPSVYCPHLDITKAKKTLHWKPTPLKDALQLTSLFFLGAEKYAAEHKKVASKFSKIQEYY